MCPDRLWITGSSCMNVSCTSTEKWHHLTYSSPWIFDSSTVLLSASRSGSLLTMSFDFIQNHVFARWWYYPSHKLGYHQIIGITSTSSCSNSASCRTVTMWSCYTVPLLVSILTSYKTLRTRNAVGSWNTDCGKTMQHFCHDVSEWFFVWCMRSSMGS